MIECKEKMENKKEYNAPQMEVLDFGAQGDLMLLDNSCPDQDACVDVTL